MQAAVADAKLQLLEELEVLHQVERIEHVAAEILGENQRVVHQHLPLGGGRKVVERIRRVQRAVVRVADDGARQQIEADKVRDAVVLWVLHSHH